MSRPSIEKFLEQAPVRRWLVVIAATVVATLLVLLALASFHSQLVALSSMPSWALEAFAWLVLTSAAVAAVAFHDLFSRVPTSSLLRFPPAWVGGLLGAAGLLIFSPTSPEFRAHFDLSLDAAALVQKAATVPLVVLGWATILAPRRAPAPDPLASLKATAPPSIVGDFDRLCSWLSSDDACGKADDAFDYNAIAARIVDRLTQARPAPQAIVGALGSGKTTLRKLASEALEARGARCRIVPVELWQFETPRAAVEGIIGTVLDAMKNDVTTIGLRGLPDSYARAMIAAGGTWETLSSFASPAKSPLSRLQEIDNRALAVKVRYVVWIEDLERFAPQGSANTEDRLGPVKALLHGLDRLEAVTVVLATTNLQVRFDLEKIARYVESLPPISASDLGRVISSFRSGCVNSSGTIDPADASARKALDKLSKPLGIEVRSQVSGPGIHGLPEALFHLTATPRTLKQGLRLCLETWQAMPGELDFDELLRKHP